MTRKQFRSLTVGNVISFQPDWFTYTVTDVWMDKGEVWVRARDKGYFVEACESAPSIREWHHATTGNTIAL